MKILIVAIPLEFPLASYCLAAQLANSPETGQATIEILHLDASILNVYAQKNSELWRFVARLEATRPDVITFSIYLWNALVARELIAIAKRLYPRISIIVGGPELATPDAAESWLRTGESLAAVRGEGEATLVEVIARLSRAEDMRGVLGCSWWDGERTVHEAPRLTSPVSSFCSPFLTGWIPDDLFDRIDNGHKGRFPRALIETYRGCYMKCSYCQWSATPRSPFPESRVLGELSWVISKKVARLFIIDATFGYKKKIAKEILRHIIKEKHKYGSNTGIVCYHNQDFFDDELFELYREAGVSVEVDLQSTNQQVLRRLGRGRWSVENFERHYHGIRRHGVSTTGSVDLIIGLPGDNLSSFEESVDFLLRRGIDVGLYQTSIIPATPMSQSTETDGVVHSPYAPRAVFKNTTFSVAEMLSARLIGHGVDFFRRYPSTAEALWRLCFAKPIDLCKAIGLWIYEKHGLMYGESWQYTMVMANAQAALGDMVRELCHEPDYAEILCDLFRLEAAATKFTMPMNGAKVRPVTSASGSWCIGENWMRESPQFCREQVEIVKLRFRVELLLSRWKSSGGFPSREEWRLAQDAAVAIVYLSPDGLAKYQVVDADFTLGLLERFNGYFTVEECLTNLAGADWREQNLFALLDTLTKFAEIGLIVPGSWAACQRILEHKGRA
jgi:radical SAM superfamily enzyme YgiQ (UPF0313 family)